MSVKRFKEIINCSSLAKTDVPIVSHIFKNKGVLTHQILTLVLLRLYIIGPIYVFEQMLD